MAAKSAEAAHSETEMKSYRKGSSRMEKKRAKIERLPPTAPGARDEGPRLIPLEDPISEPSRLEHYLDLADAALGLRPGQSPAGRRRLERGVEGE